MMVKRIEVNGATYALFLGTTTPFVVAKLEKGEWKEVEFTTVPRAVTKALCS